MKKIVSLTLAILMIFSLACGCSSSGGSKSGGSSAAPATAAANTAAASAAAPGQTALTWGSWALYDSALSPIYSKMYKNFEQANSDIKVEQYGYAYKDYLDQLVVAVSSGKGPDVAHIKAEWLPALLDIGAVKSISGVLSNEVLADYNKASIDSVTVDGEMVALPWFSNTSALAVNTELLGKVGWSIDQIKDWDSMTKAAEAIAALKKDANGNTIYGLAYPFGSGETGEGINIFPALWAYGGDFIDSTGKKIMLSSDNSVKAFTSLQKLVLDKVSTPVGTSFKDLRTLFGQGTIGMYWDIEAGVFTSRNFASDPKKFDERTKMIVIPELNGPNGFGYNNAHLLVVFDYGDKTTKKMPAIKKFLEFMSGSDVIKILFDANQGKMSGRASVMKTVFGNVTGNTSVYVNAMQTSRPLPNKNAAFQNSDKEISNILVALAQGQDVKQAVGTYEKKIQAMYDEKK